MNLRQTKIFFCSIETRHDQTHITSCEISLTLTRWLSVNNDQPTDNPDSDTTTVRVVTSRVMHKYTMTATRFKQRFETHRTQPTRDGKLLNTNVVNKEMPSTQYWTTLVRHKLKLHTMRLPAKKTTKTCRMALARPNKSNAETVGQQRKPPKPVGWPLLLSLIHISEPTRPY